MAHAPRTGPRPKRPEWEEHKSLIRRLYLDDDRRAEEIVRILASELRFQVKVPQLKYKLGKWKFQKNLPHYLMKEIADTYVPTGDESAKVGLGRTNSNTKPVIEKRVARFRQREREKSRAESRRSASNSLQSSVPDGLSSISPSVSSASPKGMDMQSLSVGSENSHTFNPNTPSQADASPFPLLLYPFDSLELGSDKLFPVQPNLQTEETTYPPASPGIMSDFSWLDNDERPFTWGRMIFKKLFLHFFFLVACMAHLLTLAKMLDFRMGVVTMYCF